MWSSPLERGGVDRVLAVKSRRRTAAAWVIRVLVLAAVAVVWFVPPLSEKTSDSATISRYDAVFDLSADGSLKITETIDVQMPFGKHGIFRIFDTRDERRNGVEHPVRDLTVTRDGQPDPTSGTTPQPARSRCESAAPRSPHPGAAHLRDHLDHDRHLERGPGGTVRWW